jgi:UDP-2,3-diacylglucosamine hydrolase
VTPLFISDLHLEGREPATIELFRDLLADEARSAESLYILGDLFEAWIGDDDDDPTLVPIVESLRALTAAGVDCAVMHGNRDFLLGPRFAAATGCRLLGDFERIAIHGEHVLLTHGDLLCTDDERYLRLRAQLRDPAWQRDFLAEPVAERRAIAADLRKLSAAEIAAKSEYIMDVNQDAVADRMRAHDVRLLVHGHTHRPGVHRFELDGAPAARIVLGAWHDGASIVRWDAHGYRLGGFDG